MSSESELKAALRRRRGDDYGSVDDDPGLPRSPPTSPTTLDVLNHGLKNCSRTTRSTCSDGSLLSMGSSENDEDSFGVISHHSSKGSLIEGRYQVVVDHEPAAGAVPLSHKAARHKISVRPRRTHAVPRARKSPQVMPPNLPTTLELNEDSSVKNRVSDPSLATSQKSQAMTRPSSMCSASMEVSVAMSRNEENERKNSRKSLPEGANIEEKKDEPFLNRLFGSVQTGQQRNDIEESSMNLFEEDQRISREKRKDPFRSSVGVKSSRQKSDSSKPFNFEDENAFRSMIGGGGMEFPVKNGSQRSSSVEGRLEGNSYEETYLEASQHQFISYASTHQEAMDVDDVIGVNKFKMNETEVSLRGLVDNDIVMRHSVVVEAMKPEPSISRIIANRLSSSYDSLDSDDVLTDNITHKKIKTHSINSLESFESESTLGERSSTDSLTTTPLPGIYIRSNNSQTKGQRPIDISKNLDLQSKAHHSIMKWKEEHVVSNLYTGPMSLDSSLTFVHPVEDRSIRNSSFDYEASVSEREDSRSSDSSRRSFGSSELPHSKPVTILRSVSVHSPASSRTPIKSKSSSGDELESDSSLPRVALRPVKREASIKKVQEDTGASNLPEFMRIQLNRVQNKGNTIIFDTEQGIALAKSNQSIPCTDFQEIKPVKKTKLIDKAEEYEKPRDQTEIIIAENMNTLDSCFRSELPFGNKSAEETSPALQFPATNVLGHIKINSLKSTEEQLKRREEKEEIVLRRPSVVDRSTVMDQNIVQMSSPPPQVNGEQQPELFKVFARRSFKLKDSELEATLEHETARDVDVEREPQPQLPSTVDPKLPNFSMSVPNDSINNIGIPTLRSISSKRYSLGSAGVVSSQPDLKPTVIVLSGNNSNFSQNMQHEQINYSGSEEDIEPIFQKSGFQSSKILSASSATPQALTPSNHYMEISPKLKMSNETDLIGYPSNTEINMDFNSNGATESYYLKKASYLNSGGTEHISSMDFLKQASTLIEKATPPVSSKSDGGTSINISPNTTSNFNSAIIKRSIVSVTDNNVSCSPPTSEAPFVSENIGQGINITPSKPVSLRAQSLFWPPRSQSIENKPEFVDCSKKLPDAAPIPITSSYPNQTSLPPSKIISSFSELKTSLQSTVTPTTKTISDQEISDIKMATFEDDSLKVNARRRKFKKGSFQDQLLQKFPNETAVDISPPIIAEARNISFAHSFENHPTALPTISGPLKNPQPLLKREQSQVEEVPQQNLASRNSLGGSPDDWRMLVRQRREDRMKQAKSPDTEELLIETRPTVSRNSKVLEMANNFQKLQVA